MLKSCIAPLIRSRAKGLGSKRLTVALYAIAIGTGATLSPYLAPAALAQAVPPTAEEFGRLPALNSLTMSPDGKHLAAVTSPDGKTTYITVWDTSDMSKPMSTIGAGRGSRFMGVSFVKNERILVSTRQLFDYAGTKSFLGRTLFTDLTGSKWQTGVPETAAKTEDDQLMRDARSVQAVSYLPNDPQSILVEGDQGVIYKSNLITGKISMVERIADRDTMLVYDDNGELRAKSHYDFDNGKFYIQQMLKNPETGQWEEHFRAYAKDREIPQIVALTKDPNIILVKARRGKDHTAIYNYNIKEKAFKDVAFEHPLFDAGGAVVDKKSGELVAFSYRGDRATGYYVDDKLAGTMESIEKALGIKSESVAWTDLATGKKVRVSVPDGDSVDLIDISDDNSKLILLKSGPSNPGTYYMYIEGKGLQPLGDPRPWIKTDLLGQGHMVQYTARDGRPIPAFVYKPVESVYGKGPFPTIIIPHGGPWGRDDLEWSLDSSWVQYFVARGFAVAMPQYRGSDGWGMAQWTAGDSKWGQEMSDDMDDVALGMVKEGIADRNRLAMHGYSFGGYSAMAAIVRPNPIYQCAISGAGPASPVSMQSETGDSRFGREFQRPFVGGLNALANVKDASIPILIYHGDRDQNVKPEESKAFYDALIANHKTATRVVFKDMGHEGNKWNPENEIQLLTMIDGFLQSGCRADGKPF